MKFETLQAENQQIRKELNSLRQLVSSFLKREQPDSILEEQRPSKKIKLGTQWDFVAPMQSVRYGHSATTHENFIYSIGGYDGKKELASVERDNR